MAWEYHNGLSKLNLQKVDKVKTQLTPFKCAIGETIENDEKVLYKKTWEVESELTDSIVLKSGKEIMTTSLNGFSLDWIHHRIYKIKK